MNTLQPSPAELIHHHVKYEFDMMNDTFARIGRYDDKIIENALIESFCIHARALLEFFGSQRGAQTLADRNYVPFPGGDPARRKLFTRKLNNQVAHLMDGRTANPSLKVNGPDRAEMRSLLSAEYAHFMSHLLPAHAATVPTTAPLTVEAGSAPPSTTNEIVIVQSTSVNTVPPTKT